MSLPDRSEDEGTQNPDRLKAYAGLLYDVSSLMTELEAGRFPNHSEYRFTFEIIGPHQIVLPQIVSEMIPGLDQIIVTLGRSIPKTNTESESPTYLSIDFMSDAQQITISRSGDPSDKKEPDVLILTSDPKVEIQHEATNIFQGRRQNISKVSQAELNAFMMSLVYPDAERGYEMFSEANLLKAEVYESLRGPLELSALNNTSSLRYDFESSDAKLYFYTEQGQSISFTLYYPGKVPGQVITAQNDMETSFVLRFKLQDAEGQAMDYLPTPEEISYLRAILNTEAAIYSPETVNMLEGDLIDFRDPEQAFIEKGKVVLSAQHIQDTLAQLEKDSLDSPDSGTA